MLGWQVHVVTMGSHTPSISEHPVLLPEHGAEGQHRPARAGFPEVWQAHLSTLQSEGLTGTSPTPLPHPVWDKWLPRSLKDRQVLLTPSVSGLTPEWCCLAQGLLHSSQSLLGAHASSDFELSLQPWAPGGPDRRQLHPNERPVLKRLALSGVASSSPDGGLSAQSG